MNPFIPTCKNLFWFLPILLLLLPLYGQQAAARKRAKSGASGEAWTRNPYANENLSTIQGATHKLWSKQTKGWIHPEPKFNGTVLEEWWCKGNDIAENTCRSGSVAGKRQRGVSWRGMGGELTEGVVDRLWLSIGMIPEAGLWGVVVYLHFGGEPLQVEQFEIEFMRLVEDAVTEHLTLAPVLHYSIEQSSFKGDLGSPHRAFSQISGSTSGLSQTASQQLEQLLANVQQGLRQGSVEKCSYGRYHGNNPPPCKRIPIENQAAEDWYYFVERELRHRIQLVQGEADVLFSLLTAYLPAEVTSKNILSK